MPISRRDMLKAGAGVAGIAWLLKGKGWAADDIARRPNILFILTDQWRAKALGYAGDPNVKTPNLDRLAKEAASFRNAVSVCPVCTPYRASLMTGRFPTSTGMFLNDLYLPDEELCFAEVLKDAGYRTGYIGKWHLDGHGRKAFIPPERRQGWDYWKVAECDHNYMHSHYYAGNDPQMKYWDGYDVFAQTRDAQTYLQAQAGKDAPFAFFLSYGAPHFPHNQVPEEYKKLYPPQSLQLAPNVPPDQEAAARRELQGYYAHCTAIDRCVGELLETLEATGLAKNTIVIFTSDHGEMMGSHNYPPKMKQVPFDESARVPLLIRYPAAQGGSAGRELATPLTTPDLTVTLLALAGIQAPPSMEGRDLSDLVRTGTEQNLAALYMHPDPWHCKGFSEYRAIRTQRHTYIRSLRDGVMLFDDVNDPHQMNNLAEKPEFAVLRDQMEQRLQAELERIHDPFKPAAYYLEHFNIQLSPYKPPEYKDDKQVAFTPQRRGK